MTNVTELSINKFFIDDNFLSEAELQSIRNDFNLCQTDGLFSEAKTGIEKEKTKARSDLTHWILDSKAGLYGSTIPQKKIQSSIEKLKNEINEKLFLGLWDFEGHYSSYGPGAFYEKHMDQFKGNSSRKVSFVLYLNDDWKSDDGGSLVLYLEKEKLEILPIGGRLVCFLSEGLEHEVLLSQRERRSFTGWFKIRT